MSCLMQNRCRGAESGLLAAPCTTQSGRRRAEERRSRTSIARCNGFSPSVTLTPHDRVRKLSDNWFDKATKNTKSKSVGHGQDHVAFFRSCRCLYGCVADRLSGGDGVGRRNRCLPSRGEMREVFQRERERAHAVTARRITLLARVTVEKRR